MFLSTLLLSVAAPQVGSLPPHQGIGPTGDVLLARDFAGTPHVFASTDAGAYFGAGWAAAEDRLFQMCWRRLMAQGRTAEFFGPGTVGNVDEYVEHDKQARLFGWARHASDVVALLDTETLRFLQAYADGVNAYVASPRARFHPLFAQHGIPIDLWTPEDSIGVWITLARHFAPNGLDEAARLHTFEDLLAQGLTVQEAIDELTGDPVCDPEAAVITQSDVPLATQQAMQAYASAKGLSGDHCSPPGDFFKFSHAWAVAGARTSTGHAVLQGEPRLTVTVPNALYEWSMRGPTVRGRGAGVAGSPNFLIGASPQVAWSLTALAMDQADAFELTVNAAGDQYWYADQWLPFAVDEVETIRVAGATDVTVRYRKSVFGPVMTEVMNDVEPGEEFAVLRVPLHDPSVDPATASVKMLRARTVQDFYAALDDFAFPSANCVFAGSDASGGVGGIGYVANGDMPVRNPNLTLPGIIAQDGTSRRSHWIDVLPHDLLPHVFNPAAGELFSANHLPVGDWYPIPLSYGSGSHGDTVRSYRLRRMFSQASAVLTPQEIQDMRLDTVNQGRADLVEVGLWLALNQPGAIGPDARSALGELGPWHAAGATMDNRHPATALAWFVSTLFRQSSAGRLVDEFGGGENGLTFYLKSMLEKTTAGTPLTNDEADYVDQQLAQAWRDIHAAVGPPSTWSSWFASSVQSKDLPHWTTLEGFPSLDPAASTSVYVATPDGGTIWSPHGQSYSHFFEAGGGDAGAAILPLGISEHANSPHFADQQASWEQGVAKPAPIFLPGVLALPPVTLQFLTY